MLQEIKRILAGGHLRPLYQPIFDLRTMSVHGFEGLIRGPSDTVLHSPIHLFNAARATGTLPGLEQACMQTLSRAFSNSHFNQKLFLNLTPDSLSWWAYESASRLEEILAPHTPPERVVIELLESSPARDYPRLIQAANQLRDQGFAIAIDDLGEGFSSLRLWSDLRPEYIKIDQHFIQGVSLDPVKLQFLRSLQAIARKTGARVVAEGLEEESDLAVILELGIEFGQGYVLGRPQGNPVHTLNPELFRKGLRHPGFQSAERGQASAFRLMVSVEPVSPSTPNLRVHERFLREPDLLSLPVVQDGIPVGLINRYAFLDAMSRHFSREIYGKKACEGFMSRDILVVDHRMSIHGLSKLIVESDPRHILHGFIVTKGGRYTGIGSGHDLMREITHLQIHAARHANPLTQLPGNVPINEYLQSLLGRKAAFHVCYCDLDHFKPFNDVHGYHRGDEVIRWTAELLRSVCDPEQDFIGHIGGDDFLLIMQSADWESRCREAIQGFLAGRDQFFDARDLERGGYESEDRLGRQVFHPLLAISIGAVRVPPGSFGNPHEISAAAAHAKKHAKRQEGCSLFLERRRPGGPQMGRSRDEEWEDL